MELELRQETVRGWESVCRATLEQEETAEMIVPDACPDIWQVLDGEARLLLQRKEPQDGKGEFSGLLKTTILYQPEGEQGLRAMEVTLPFSASPELTQLTRRSMLHVIPRVLSVDVHLLNPRKVLVRVGYCLDIEGFEPQARSLTSLVEEPERYGIRQKTGELRSFQTVYAQEKAFTYQDTVVLPAGRPDAVELLRTRAQCTCTEARVIGSKLVFKGEAMLQLLCRGEDGALFTGEFHLPYSQIMDAGEDSEEGMCSMDLLFTDVKCTPVEEDRRSFQVELAVQAQAVLRREVTVPILTDLYSTAYEVQPEEEPVLYSTSWDRERSRRASGRWWEPRAFPAIFWMCRPGWAGPVRARKERTKCSPRRWSWWCSMTPRRAWRLPAKKWWCSIACPARAAGRRCSPRSFSGNPPLRRREREWRFLSPWPSAGWFWKRRRPR